MSDPCSDSEGSISTISTTGTTGTTDAILEFKDLMDLIVSKVEKVDPKTSELLYKDLFLILSDQNTLKNYNKNNSGIRFKLNNFGLVKLKELNNVIDVFNNTGGSTSPGQQNEINGNFNGDVNIIMSEEHQPKKKRTVKIIKGPVKTDKTNVKTDKTDVSDLKADVKSTTVKSRKTVKAK
mgnify:CR=1 FL=1